MRGRHRKEGSRKPSGQLRYMRTDYGPEYGAMQRVARVSEIAGEAALANLGRLAALERRADLTREESVELRGLQEDAEILIRQARDKRASYPLGILYAKGLIFSGLHYAGRRYAALFVAAVRPPSVPSILGNLTGAMPPPFDPNRAGTVTSEDIRQDYMAARQALDREGVRVVRVVDETVVYEEGVPASGSFRLRCLTDGLRALGGHFEDVDEIRRARVV